MINMGKTYTDKITQKTIQYKENCIFTIETRSRFNKRFIKRVFKSEDIDLAFKEFYDTAIIEGYYKYLYMRAQEKSESEVLILRMRGFASKASMEDLRLKNKRPLARMKTASIANLTNCPITLSNKLKNENILEYPVSINPWTNSKIVFCLLSYLLSLSKEEKLAVLREGDKQLSIHKEFSGYPIEEDNMVKVDVVTKDDLL
jgi:hypothetical protein